MTTNGARVSVIIDGAVARTLECSVY